MSSASISKRKLDVIDDATSKRIRLEPRVAFEPTVETNRVADLGLLRTVDVQSRYDLATNPIATLNMPGITAFYDSADVTKFTLDGSGKVLTWLDSMGGVWPCTAFGAGGGPVRDGNNGLVFTGTEALRALVSVSGQYSNGTLTSNNWVIAVVTPSGLAADSAAKTTRALVSHPTYKVGLHCNRVFHSLCGLWDLCRPTSLSNCLFIGAGSGGDTVYYITAATGGNTNVRSMLAIQPLVSDDPNTPGSASLAWSAVNGALVEIAVAAKGELWALADTASLGRSVWHYAASAWTFTVTSVGAVAIVSAGTGASYLLNSVSGVSHWTGAAWVLLATTGLPGGQTYRGIFMRTTVPHIIIQVGGGAAQLFKWDGAAAWTEIDLSALGFPFGAALSTAFAAAQGYRGYTAVVGNRSRWVLFVADGTDAVSERPVPIVDPVVSTSCGPWPNGALEGMRTAVAHRAAGATRAMLWAIDGNDRVCRYDFTTTPADGDWLGSNVYASTLVVNAASNVMQLTGISGVGSIYVYAPISGPCPLVTGLQADTAGLTFNGNAYVVGSAALGKVWLYDTKTLLDAGFASATYGHMVAGTSNATTEVYVATAGVLNAVIVGTLAGATVDALEGGSVTWAASKTDFAAPIVDLACSASGTLMVLLSNHELWFYDWIVWTNVTAAFVTATNLVPQKLSVNVYWMLTGLDAATSKGLLVALDDASPPTLSAVVDLTPTTLGNTANCQLTGVAYDNANEFVYVGGTTPCGSIIRFYVYSIAASLADVPLGADLTWFQPATTFGTTGGMTTRLAGLGNNGAYAAEVAPLWATFAPAYWPPGLEPGYGLPVDMGVQLQPFMSLGYAAAVTSSNGSFRTDALTYIGPTGDLVANYKLWQSDAVVADGRMAVVACSPQTTISIGPAESYVTPIAPSAGNTNLLSLNMFTGLDGPAVLIGTDDDGAAANYTGRLHALVSLSRSAQTAEVHAVMRWLSDRYGVTSLGRAYIPELPLRATALTCDTAQCNVAQTQRLLVGRDGATGGMNLSDTTIRFYPRQPFENPGGVLSLPPEGASITASTPAGGQAREEVPFQCDLSLQGRSVGMAGCRNAAVAIEYAVPGTVQNQTLDVSGTGPSDTTVTTAQPFRVRVQSADGNAVRVSNPATTNVASAGGDVHLVTGGGGASAYGNVCTAGAAGSVTYAGGTGGSALSATATATGGAGGGVALVCGTGGAAATVNGVVGTASAGGKGGSVAVTAGTGGTGSGALTNVSGAGGDIALTLGKSGGAAAAGGTLTVANYTANEGAATTRVQLTPAGNLVTSASVSRAQIGTASLVLNGGSYTLFNTAPTSIVDVTALANALGPGAVSINGIGFGAGGVDIPPLNGAQMHLVARSNLTVVLTIATAAPAVPAWPITSASFTIAASSAVLLVFYNGEWVRSF